MKIAFLGDIALFGNCSKSGNSNILNYFQEIADLLGTFDYVVGNLETPFSKKKEKNGAKSAYICSDPDNIELLSFLHINAVTLANNHIFDYGKEGFSLTKKLLENAGIEYFGVDGKEHKLEKDGNKICFTGYCCYSTNPLNTVPYGEDGVNEFNVAKVLDNMRANEKAGYLNVLAVHAGKEHVNYPSNDSVLVAHKFAKVMPYLYYGSHPHVAQGIEQVDGSLIAYSLGNFCFDDVYSSVSSSPLVELSENNRSSFVLEVEIINNRICSYHLIPIYIGKDKIHVGRGTSENDMKRYTDPILSMPSEEYEEMRNKAISNYYGKRVSQRNIMWYLRRLRPRYFKLFFLNKENIKKYNQCVKAYL